MTTITTARLLVAFCLLGLTPAAADPAGIVRVRLIDQDKRPIEGVAIADAGLGQPSAPSDRAGLVDLTLRAEAQVGEMIQVVVPVPWGQEWIALDDIRAVPLPGQALPVTITLLRRETASAIQVEAAGRIQAAEAVAAVSRPIPEAGQRPLSGELRESVVLEVAASYGLTKEQFLRAAEATSHAEGVSFLERGVASLVSGNYDAAAQALEQAHGNLVADLALAEEQTQSTRKRLAEVARYQAQVASRQSRLEEAVSKYGESLSYVPNDPGTLHELSSLLLSLGRDFEAEAYARAALRVTRKTGGTDLAYSLVFLSHVFRARGDFAMAEDLLKEAASEFSVSLGSTHLETLKAWSELAQVLGTSDRLNEAREIQERLVRELSSSRGTLHPSTLREQGNLAVTAMNQGDAHEARVLLESTLYGQCDALGDNHRDTRQTRVLLAMLALNRGEPETPQDQFMIIVQTGIDQFFPGPIELRPRCPKK